LKSEKLLVVNADDFGFTTDVNRGIVEAHRNGIVTATTLMAAGAAFDDAVRLADENPTLDIGCHLVLVGSRSALHPEKNLPPDIPALIRTIALRRMRIFDELAAQVKKILAAGIRPTHLDTHKHTHLLPEVAWAVGRVSRTFGIPWVRGPLRAPLFATITRLIFRYHGCRSTGRFAGFRMTGRFGTEELVKFLKELPGGTTEFMCHPGFCEDELLRAPTRLKQSRARELEALTAPATRRAIEQAGIRLAAYRDL